MDVLKIFFLKAILIASAAASELYPELKIRSRYLAEYSIFKIDIQYISLETSKRYASAKKIIASPESKGIRIEYLRDLDTDVLSQAWDVSYDTVLGKDREKYKKEIKKIKSFLRDVSAGDEVYVLFQERSLKYYFNGKLLGEIEGQDFVQATLSIWIGEKPVDDDMKNGMLKKILQKSIKAGK